MSALFFVLTPIALLDSASILPLCLVFLVVLLAGPRPVLGSMAHIAGVLAANVVCGLVLLFGLESVFDEINAYAVRLWNDPNTEELVLQILLGLLACGFGLRMARGMARGAKAREAESEPDRLSPARAFVAGAGLVVVGLPGALPYFAAIDLILRADLGLPHQVSALIFYNVIFVLPLIAMVGLRLALGARSLGLLGAVKRTFDEWSGRLIGAALFVLGAVLIVDGIGWFLGRPLIAV